MLTFTFAPGAAFAQVLIDDLVVADLRSAIIWTIHASRVTLKQKSQDMKAANQGIPLVMSEEARRRIGRQ
ncbi:hypothetical protein AC628_28425 [Bradyrhizobium sp. NAS96.2]|nr:hypothetical protein AC628_28425 [Bradyrhizobium sp. NAS96.2]